MAVEKIFSCFACQTDGCFACQTDGCFALVISIRCFISLTSIEYFILPTTIGVCFALLKLTASHPRLPRFEILLYLSHYFPRNLSSRRMMITHVLR